MFTRARSFPLLLISLLTGVACTQSAWAQGPTPGQNVNMVSGTQWPGGDPFLQRQNEPSIAVSSRNPQHLLAGANDYRTVDLNFFATGETGDAWLGVFKSFDGGATWQSTLLPGYPLDRTPEGLASPLKTPTQFQAASDPVVRAGTNGLFFYSGIAFNRTQNSGVVFVSRFMDLNNKENGTATTTTSSSNTDPIRYIGTAVLDSGSAGQFLDKPWIAVDIPRSTATCTITVPENVVAPDGTVTVTQVTQKIPAGNVYMAWSDFVGNSLLRTKVYFSRSTDCGATWSTPVKLTETYPLNQGVTIAIDPATGNVYVAWRTVAAASTPDGINVAKSIDMGQTFTKAVEFVTLPPFNPSSPSATPSFFDENTLTTSGGGPEMRTTAFPSMAIDGCGQIYVAWSQRDPQSSGDSRIMMSTSMDGVNWTAPFRVDNNPISDDYSNSFARGNQFMPSLTFAAGKLMVLYYDLHLDHTLGAYAPAYTPAYNFSPDGFPIPDKQGRLVLEQRVGIPETAPIFGPFVNDAGLTAMRHVLDVRVAQFTPVAIGGACPSGSVNFATARVSQYRFGTTGLNQSSTVQQLEVNPPNLPIFEGGVAPFLGDYVDIAGSTISPSGNSWVFNTAPASAPVHIATWTDNRDVQPPLPNAQGVVDWTKYTPILPGQSVFDPTQPRPPCDATATASRNQNIYSSRITQGLVVASPQTSKPLSTTLQRAFVILVQNFTPAEKSFRLSIPNQPLLANGSLDPSGFASFVATSNPPPAPPLSPVTQLDVTIGLHNGITRPVFALSGNPTASITINVQEITAPGGSPVPNGLTSFLVLNADGTVPGLIDPDGAPAGTTIVGVEVYNPNVSSPNVSSPNVSSPNVSSPNVSSPNVSSPNVSSPNVSSQSFANSPQAGLAVPNVSSPNVSSPNVSSPNVSSPNVSSPNVSSPNVSSNPLTTTAPISDSNYVVTNNGNTSASYHVQLVSAQPVTSPLQLLLNKIYANPVAVGCSLGLQQSNVLLADVSNPPIQSAANFSPTDTATDPTVAKNSSVANTTFSLAPGEQAFLTLRGPITGDAMKAISEGLLAPVVTSQAANTNTNKVPFSFPGGSFPGGGIFVLQGLPDAITGTSYSGQIRAFGGTPPLTWSITSGSLPPTSAIPAGNLTLDPTTGLISGVPGCSPGVFCIFPTTFPFTVQVTDSAGHAASQQLSIRVATPLTALTTSLPPAVQNSPYINTLSSRGGIPPITWSVTGLPAGLTPSARGSITGVATTPGVFNVRVQATDSSFPPQTTPATVLALTVFANTGLISFVQQPTSTAAGVGITPAVSVKLTDTTGAVVPGATVAIAIGNNPSGGTLSGTTSSVSDATGNAVFPNLSIDVPGTGYTLIASAIGAGGVASNPFNIFVAPPRALTAAAAPPGSVTLNWTPSVSSPVLGYNVYRATVSGGFTKPLLTVNAFSFIDNTVLSGQTYFYVVTALGLNNSESVFSNQATASVSSGAFGTAAPMQTSRLLHTATSLPNGKILIVGGTNVINSTLITLNTAELYDPSTGMFTPTANTMLAGRTAHTATLLVNGQVLIAGGTTFNALGSEVSRQDAELYDPVSNSFISTTLIPMVCARDFHTATLLKSGKVLVAGGRLNAASGEVSITCAEVYDPTTGTFTAAGNLTAVRALHTATLLPSGKVLIAGGRDLSNGNAIGTAELYDPNNAITPFRATSGALSTARSAQTATLLTTGPNTGKVLVVGGLLSTSGVPALQTLTTAEIYDPSTDTFTNSTSQMSNGRFSYTATLLKNGKILLTGGVNNFQASPGGPFTGSILNSAELYDPMTDSFSTTGSLSIARGQHAAARIEINGTVLVTGGSSTGGGFPTNTSEIYVP